MQRITHEQPPPGNIFRLQGLPARLAFTDKIGAQDARKNATVEWGRQQLPIRHFDEDAGRGSLAQLAALVEKQNLIRICG